MPDFTSALYLGIEHESRQLAGWERLTLGKPAALESPPGAAAVERDLAALVGCERALLGPSTLHLFWDLLAMLSGHNIHLFMDDGVYPIAQWAVERAAARGTPVTVFPRHNAGALDRAVPGAGARRPVVVADGFCTGCGTPAPLGAYLDCVAARGGLVVIDDTQALGIMGHEPGPEAPYGSGGAGLLALAGIRDPRVVVVSSLAKGLGAPVAVLAGPASLVSEFESRSLTRVHCSPPSAAAIAAAANALDINRREGDARRRTLADRVARFRCGIGDLAASASLFPVQHLRLPARAGAPWLYEQLWARGVQTVLTRGINGSGARIGFVLTARHRESEIDRAVAVLWEMMDRQTQMQHPQSRRRQEAANRRQTQWEVNQSTKVNLSP